MKSLLVAAIALIVREGNRDNANITQIANGAIVYAMLAPLYVKV